MFDHLNDFVPTLDSITGPREASIGELRFAYSFAHAHPLSVGHRENDDRPLLTPENAGKAGERVVRSRGCISRAPWLALQSWTRSSDKFLPNRWDRGE